MDKWSSNFSADIIPFTTGIFVGVGTILVYYKLFRRSAPVEVGARVLSSFERAAKLTRLRALNLGRNHKMVFVVRTDLGMGKGKIAAQCAHAAIKCYQRAQETDPTNLDIWEATGCTKICLKFDLNETQLRMLEYQAKQAGIVTGLICDAGYTQIAHGSYTVLGLGPAPVDEIDKLTGHLKLL